MMYKPFTLSVKVIIRDDKGRVLLLKRSATSKGNPGKWDLPGGKVDTGETLEEGLLREMAEETGLKISLKHVLGAAESEAPAKRVAYLIFEGLMESGKIKLSTEHDDYAWVESLDVDKIDLSPQFRPFTMEYIREKYSVRESSSGQTRYTSS